MTQLIIATDRTDLGRSAAVSVPNQSARASGQRSIQISVEAEQGPVSATVRLLGCNDGRFPIELAVFTLSSSGTWDTDVFADDSHCEQYLIDVVSRSANARISAVGSI